MKVLVVNDDGVKSEGIKFLVEKLYKYCEKIWVVAPMEEKSATSHSLTIRQGLSYKKLDNIYKDVETYAISGSPADCVSFAYSYFKFDFDTVFSGANRGYNLADDIIYSGTVAGASEGIMKGKRGVAVSCKYDSFEALNQFDNVMEYLLNSQLWNEKVLININIPKDAKGIKITHQAKSTYQIEFIRKEDGLLYSSCDTSYPLVGDDNGDLQTIKQGYISISPLTIDSTDYNIYNKYH